MISYIYNFSRVLLLLLLSEGRTSNFQNSCQQEVYWASVGSFVVGLRSKRKENLFCARLICFNRNRCD